MDLRTILITIIFTLFTANLYSQHSKIVKKKKSVTSVDTTIYLVNKTEKIASFKGGDSLLLCFFISHFKWKINSNIQNTFHYQIAFVVEKNGSRTYYPFQNKINYDKDDWWIIDSILSIIKKMPAFEPATINEKKVRSSNYIDVNICTNREIFIQNYPILPSVNYDNCDDCQFSQIAYNNPCKSDTIEIINFAEQMPEFEGGQEACNSFIQKNIKYPSLARENNIEGRVQVQFVVWSDGKISQVKALTNKAWGLEEEAIRVVKMMPLWKPGKQNSKPVNVKFSIPIMFNLQK